MFPCSPVVVMMASEMLQLTERFLRIAGKAELGQHRPAVSTFQPQI